MKTTITEALADIKTSFARIEKKRAQVNSFLGRDSRIRDPHEAEGGSREFVRRERQSIADLEEKIVKIRSAIQVANQSTTIEIEGRVRTVAEWLNWRREVSEPAKKFLGQITSQLQNLRAQAVRQGQGVVTVATQVPAMTATGDLLVNVDETALAEEIDKMERVLGTLDGRLSLINATTMIDV
jgi:DNA-binding transcriptional regulator YiaG